jgi:undecaprenyl-diphosphatase
MADLYSFDVWLFQQINGFIGTYPLFDRFMATMVNEYFVPVSMSLLLLVLWLAGGSPERRMLNQKAVFYAILAEIVVNGIVKLNNLLYFRQRPFADMQVNLLFYHPTDSSFPSNPASVGFAFATAVFVVNRKVGTALYALATLFAASRVYSGVHYPLDVVGGALVGIFGAGIAYLLASGPLNGGIERVIGAVRRVYLA